MTSFRILLTPIIVFLVAQTAFAETDTLTILHTNDIHDHVLPGYEGGGGIPYVSSYIRNIEQGRNDVLVLDGGDVMEKGDLVAFRTHSEITFEAMGHIGYDACAVGNHDYDHGGDHVRHCETLANGMAILSINWTKPDGSLQFPASKTFEVDGVKVGVIGVLVPQDKNCLDLDATARAIKEESERLDEECHLVIALCHLGFKDCAEVSAIAPAVDILVGGHTHQAFFDPLRVKETGAMVLQAGFYAQHVGRLDLTLDLDEEKILDHTYELVEMNHDTIPVDQELLERIEKRQEEVCPEADDIVGQSDVPLSYGQAGWLAAAALRDHGNVDIGFCHPAKVIRAGISPGAIDVNALFRTGGERGNRLVEVEATGAEIASYVSGLLTTDWGETVWSGFRAEEVRNEEGEKVYRTDLDSEKTYRFIMPHMEWDQRFARWHERQGKDRGEWNVKDCAFTWIDAVAAYTKGLTEQGASLDRGVWNIIQESKLEG